MSRNKDSARSPTAAAGLANFGLGVLAMVFATLVFVAVGATTEIWAIEVGVAALGLACGALFGWRRRPHFAIAAAAAIVAATLGAFGGGPELAGVSAFAWCAAAALAVLFWPILLVLEG